MLYDSLDSDLFTSTWYVTLPFPSGALPLKSPFRSLRLSQAAMLVFAVWRELIRRIELLFTVET
jgi:hypothetical protein